MTDKQAIKAVEAALLRRALGYTVTERRVTDGARSGMVTTEITREIAPDVAAARWWLVNRAPDRWAGTPDAIAPQGGGVIMITPVADASLPPVTD